MAAITGPASRAAVRPHVPGGTLQELQARLREAGLEVEVRIIKTTSEHHPEMLLSAIDQRDVFTRQLDEALLSGEIDLAVHSAKDVPTEVPVDGAGNHPERVSGREPEREGQDDPPRLASDSARLRTAR